jgi:hypothetical protein
MKAIWYLKMLRKACDRVAVCAVIVIVQEFMQMVVGCCEDSDVDKLSVKLMFCWS